MSAPHTAIKQRRPSHRRILASTVTLNNLTTQELLKHAEDMMREDQEFLKDFNAAVDQLQKKQEKFQTEHHAFGRTPSSDSPFYGKKILLKVLSIVEGMICRHYANCQFRRVWNASGPKLGPTRASWQHRLKATAMA